MPTLIQIWSKGIGLLMYFGGKATLEQIYHFFLRVQQIRVMQHTPERLHRPKTVKDQTQTHPPSSELKLKLDSILLKDYSMLRQSSDIKVSDLQCCSNNSLILEYVRNIYEEYQLPDPLAAPRTPQTKPKSNRKTYLTMLSTQQKKYVTPVKRLETTMFSELLQQEDVDFVENETSVLRKEEGNNSTTLRASMSYFEGKEISYEEQSRRLDNKELAVVIENEAKLPSQLESSLNSGRGLPPNIDVTIQEVPIPPLPKVAAARVDESFRYCVGCECALLHVNISQHQKICLPFQQIFAMQPVQILAHLKLKIHNFEAKIRNQSQALLLNGPQALNEQSEKVLQQSRSVLQQGMMTKGYQQQYNKAMDLVNKWCSLTQMINRLNWFLKIRQSIRRQFDL